MKAWTYYFKGGLTGAEISGLVEYGLQEPLRTGTIGAGGTVTINKETRNSNVRFLGRRPELQWLFDRVTLMALRANKDCFYLDLGAEPYLSFSAFQFTEYKASEKQHYNWHTDNAWTPAKRTPTDRKLSCVILLTEPSEYEGGQLELEDVGVDKNLFSSPGDVIFFPSHLKHRVTTVTAGTRHSLVTWIKGPRLK